MDDELQEVCVDAVGYDHGKARVRSQPESGIYDKLKKVSNEFSLEDLKTAFFLYMDIFKNNPQNFLDLVQQDETILRQRFENYCLNHQLKEDCLLELVGTMKRYKLLKDIGMCKHTFENMKSRFKNISCKWKFFYCLCEDLDDDEIIILKNRFLPTLSENICGEELFCHLLLKEIINYQDLSTLKKGCEEIHRDDLVKKIDLFTNKNRYNVSFEKNLYSIRDPTLENPCGLAVIFNQEKFQKIPDTEREKPTLPDRKGSRCDRDNLQSLWKSFGFQVELHDNLSSRDIERQFEVMSKRDLSNFDVFVACILSHGIHGSIYGADANLVSINDLICAVANKCQSLIGKPKLFFIQACQGEKHQKGISPEIMPSTYQFGNVTTDSRPQSEISVHPEYSDVYEASATYPGYVSYRDELSGSLFVTALNQYLKLYGTKEDINSVMNRVKDFIGEQNIPLQGEKYKQMAIVKSTLRKNMIFKHVI